ncbi:hypothetical protein GN244_ATG12429 [Phytophthora infestans]|uniref:Uncharacterized protein n=1 Tax=Phytophthora infestans TaxID=4787 RepID=A0A833WB33_PHYIN|nr:hypothetical protein GN244_ATG12429 [Phytophthora infestans]KAF4135172.1 hypothetical protein GN958_ATG15666 [Phytophthora infestans]KAF4137074.1 hypothetical protein GN958_ATG13720 [Phytophthora infestans]KAF4143395.1 hypothetical protein GN958_ATG07412 [Phytophthora infestans]KAF4143398.1 hypothetical protein GN958_ATG07415 [Phytophthora infestans]
MGEGATSVDNLPVKGRASEAEEQKTDTEEGPEPKQPEDGDEGRRQDGADGRRRYGRKRPRPSETECATDNRREGHSSSTRARASGSALAEDGTGSDETGVDDQRGDTGVDATRIETRVPSGVRRRTTEELQEMEQELRRVADEEDEEPRIYTLATRRRRGPDSLAPKNQRLARIQPNETVVERRRRRYRSRTGRYVMEFKVERVLWHDGRVRTEQWPTDDVEERIGDEPGDRQEAGEDRARTAEPDERTAA